MISHPWLSGLFLLTGLLYGLYDYRQRKRKRTTSARPSDE